MQRILEIRYLVGFLGEKAQCNWWPTSFYEASSIRFLEPIFTRTAPLAQYHGVVEAARRFHDENLNVGSYHLFRLPEETEQDLHAIAQSEAAKIFAPNLIADQETALNALTGNGHVDDAVGPVLAGRIGDLHETALLDKITAIYRQALSSNTPAFPYLVQ